MRPEKNISANTVEQLKTIYDKAFHQGQTEHMACRIKDVMVAVKSYTEHKKLPVGDFI